MNIANIFGATGLVGSALVEYLLENKYYDEIHVFVRRQSHFSGENIKEHVVDFEKLEDSKHVFNNGDYFCCLGTTRKKAGSKRNFERVDLDYPKIIAKMAKSAGTERFIAVSSIGTSANALGHYLQTKYRMEQALQQFNFKQLSIVRPSLLLGDRKENRFGEDIGSVLYKFAAPVLRGKLSKYRAIHAKDVAKAMFVIARTDKPKIIYESDELQEFADKSKP